MSTVRVTWAMWDLTWCIATCIIRDWKCMWQISQSTICPCARDKGIRIHGTYMIYRGICLCVCSYHPPSRCSPVFWLTGPSSLTYVTQQGRREVKSRGEGKSREQDVQKLSQRELWQWHKHLILAWACAEGSAVSMVSPLVLPSSPSPSTVWERPSDEVYRAFRAVSSWTLLREPSSADSWCILKQ